MIRGKSGTRGYDTSLRNGQTIKRRKRLRQITHDEMLARAKKEADAYFMLKPDSNTEPTTSEEDRKKLPRIKWKISHHRKDMRTGPTRRVRPSFYVSELFRAEEARHD